MLYLNLIIIVSTMFNMWYMTKNSEDNRLIMLASFIVIYFSVIALNIIPSNITTSTIGMVLMIALLILELKVFRKNDK